MRRPLAFAVALILGSLAGCGAKSDSEQVRDTLKRYQDAVAKRDVQTLCDALLAPAIVAKLAEAELPCELTLKHALAGVHAPQLEVRRVQVDGIQALAHVHSTARGERPSDDTIRLVKVAGGWRVAALSLPQPQPPAPVGP